MVDFQLMIGGERESGVTCRRPQPYVRKWGLVTEHSRKDEDNMRMMINKSKSSSFSRLCCCCFEGGKWQLVAKSGRTWLAWVWHCSLHAAPPLPFSALFMSTRANRCSHKWWCSQAASKSNWWSASNDLGHWGRRRQKSWFEQNTWNYYHQPSKVRRESCLHWRVLRGA